MNLVKSRLLSSRVVYLRFGISTKEVDDSFSTVFVV
jgi:hypothetical protein